MRIFPFVDPPARRVPSGENATEEIQLSPPKIEHAILTKINMLKIKRNLGLVFILSPLARALWAVPSVRYTLCWAVL